MPGTAERASGGEDAPDVAGSLDQAPGDVTDLNHLILLANDGQVLASVAANEALAVGYGGGVGGHEHTSRSTAS